MATKIIHIYNGETVVNMIVPSFFIGSSSNLHVLRTGIKTRKGSIFGHIGLFALMSDKTVSIDI